MCSFFSKIVITISAVFAAWGNVPTYAQTAPSQIPLFLTAAAQPAVLLNLGRDHKLYYEAYNDATDINGDGVVDTRYTPDDYSININGTTTTVKGIDYFGLFDSYKCYTYSSGKFVPAGATPNKKCTSQWSGDFLNYVTTTRIDALRKVLYGGKRFIDSSTETVLERNYIPQDAHSFGKEYVSIAASGYDITKYTPLALPAAGKNILFANVTRLNTGSGEPRLRVMTGKAPRRGAGSRRQYQCSNKCCI
jgi:type IV pilus assembly protein PilY1